MLDALQPTLLVMIACVLMVTLARAYGLLEPARQPRRCPSCGRRGDGDDGCSCV